KFDLNSAAQEIMGDATNHSVRFYLNQNDLENGITISNPGSYPGNVGSVLATVTSLESGCESLPVSVVLETAAAFVIDWIDSTPVCTDPAGNFLTPVSLGENLGDDYIYTWNLPNDPDGDGVQNAVLVLDQYP